MLNPHKRKKLLKSLGFEDTGKGKGSHSIWRHKGCGEAVLLCGKPAKYTWEAILKQAKKIDADYRKAKKLDGPKMKNLGKLLR